MQSEVCTDLVLHFGGMPDFYPTVGYMVTGNHGEEGFHSGNYHKNPWISIVGFYNFMGGPHKKSDVRF